MKQYVLHEDCRVRREEFGLLFYDLKGPKLLFVASGNLLEPDAFAAGTSGSALAARSPAERRRLERLLRTLAVKGFVREQSIR